MDEGILSLRWNNHRSTFFHILSTLHQKELYSDVTIACEGKFFPVHKLVLSVCSEYFEDMFKKTNCKHPIIVLKDILCDEFEALLNYMYVGEANVAQSDLARLIKAAECLRIRGLAVPDENPESNDSKRPSSSVGKEDTSSPKRRRQEEIHDKEPSTSSREIHNDRQSYKEGETSNSRQSTSNAPSRNSSASPLHNQERRSNSNHGSQTVTEVVLDDEPVVKTEPKIEEEIIIESSSMSYEAEKQGGSGGGSQTYEAQMLNQAPHNVLQEIMTQGMPSGQTESIPHWENSGSDGGGGGGGFLLEGFSTDDSSSRASQQLDLASLGLSANTCPYNATRNENVTEHINRHYAQQVRAINTDQNNANTSSSQITSSGYYLHSSESGSRNYDMNVQRYDGNVMAMRQNKYGIPHELLIPPSKEERAHASQGLNNEIVPHVCPICKKTMKNCYKTVLRPHYEQEHNLPQDITYRILRIL